MINIVIVDDQKEVIQFLKENITKNMKEDVSVISFTSASQLMHQINTLHDCTIVFMDIMLGDASGITLAKVLPEYIKQCAIVFMSSDATQLMKIADSEYCTFLYKPDFDKRFPQVMEKAIQTLDLMKANLVIKKKDKMIVIPIETISYLQRELRTTHIVTNQETINTGRKFDELAEHLTQRFVQCHHSYIVNLSKVKEYKRTSFVLFDGKEIPISRSYGKKVKEMVMSYLGNGL